MFWNRNKTSVCTYWDCRKEAAEENVLCPEHQKMWEEGLLDKCPRCGRLKETIYNLCLDCYVGRKIKEKKLEPPPPMPSQFDRLQKYVMPQIGIDNEAERCFVYVLEVGDGTLYVGHSQDIQDRLKEVRKPPKSSDTVKPPKLRYLETLSSIKKAKNRVLELREYVDTSPGYINTLSREFYRNMERIGFDIS